MKRLALLIVCYLPFAAAHAGEVEVVKAVFEHQAGGWTVNVTLRHADTGWQHYADAWRVVDAKGKVLATRTLFHPHEHEQPFTRSLSGVRLPPGTRVVFVEAHDLKHGWSPQRVEVDFSRRRGERFEVR